MEEKSRCLPVGNGSAFSQINKARLWLAISVLVGTVGFGCTRTVTGGYEDSPDKKYRVYARTYGAYGHAFVDETSKKIRISIVTGDTNETLLLRKRYHLRGSDVTWNATWDQSNNLTVVVYDFGRGLDRVDAKKQGTSTNHLLTLVYRLDPKTGKFSEVSPKS